MPPPRAVTAAFFLSWLAIGASHGAMPRALAQDVTNTTTHTERPPPGSWRRGLLPMPVAAVAALGALVVLGAGALLVLRARKSSR